MVSSPLSAIVERADSLSGKSLPEHSIKVRGSLPFGLLETNEAVYRTPLRIPENFE
jgi:hypothetical protein